MCSTRILRRLRLVTNSRQKRPIKDVLQQAIRSLEQLEDQKFQKLLPIAKLFVERAKEAMKLTDLWAKHQTTARLQMLVEGFYGLWRVGDLHGLLGTIPNRALDPNSRRSLVNVISKVARYREAARFLYRTAKKFPLVQRMRTVLVDLPQDVFYAIPVKEYTPILQSTISRTSAQYGQWNLGHICRLVSTTEREASDQFAQQTRKTLKEAKIHAEIQLLFYSELKASNMAPRVVCSSKDACFLCNAFIVMYGKMYTPRSHGRLYPGWRLPLLPNHNGIEQRFNQALENYVKNSIRTLLLRQQRTDYPHPNESTLLTLPVSASTLRSLALLEAVTLDDRETMQPQQFNNTAAEGNHLISSSPQDCLALENVDDANYAEQTEAIIAGPDHVKTQTSPVIAGQPVPLILSAPQGLLSRSTVDDNSELIQGQMLSRSIKVNHKSKLYNAGHLEIQIEYSIQPSQIVPHSTARKFAYGIKWLTVEDVERLQEHEATSIIDAESLDGEISLEVDELNCVYISGRGSILKVLLYPRIASASDGVFEGMDPLIG
jgi:OTT_1508-like deaminase